MQPPILRDVAEVASCDDVDVLWRTLVAARGDEAAVGPDVIRAAEQRMRDLQGERRFAHLTDDELEQRIAALSGQRGATDMLGHSPGADRGGDEDIAVLNRAIRANQHVGLEVTLAALLAERERRRGDA